MDKKNAAVFPYDRGFEPVLEHAFLMDMLSVNYLTALEGYIEQDQIFCGGRHYTVKEQLTPEEMAQVDILWLVDSFYQVPEETVLQKVREFAGNGKDILSGQVMESHVGKQIQEICREAEVRLWEPAAFMKEYHPVEKECMTQWEQCGPPYPLEVKQISTPVVMVLGDGELCDKFELQLLLREYMLRKNYRVCSIGSRTGCETVGVYSHPAFMKENFLSETEKIVSYNNYMKELERQENPDVFILGIPGGMLPLSKKKFGDFGVRAYEIFQAVSPDYVVLSLHMGEYNRKYMEELQKLFYYRFNSAIDCFYFSSYGIDSFSFHQNGVLKYLVFPDENVREAIDRIDGIPNIYCRQNAGLVAEHAEKTLRAYAQAQII